MQKSAFCLLLCCLTFQSYATVDLLKGYQYASEQAPKGNEWESPENAYLFMHGHTLMDNVVMILLNSVCEKLRAMSIAKITASKKQGVALKNEMANYTNSLRSIRDVLLDNENYTKCPLYKRLQRDIEKYIARTIWNMKRSGAIRDDSTWTVLRNMRQGSEIK